MDNPSRRKPRRRAQRTSDAPDYDRGADAPAPGAWDDHEPETPAGAVDDDGPVIDDADDKGAADRLLDDRPPHYGGD